MTRMEFFEELNKLLEGISSEEKAEAIGFYENYFDDAGIENEEVILTELGSPQKVAESIKQSINSNEREQLEQGYFTEKGYEDGYSSLNRQEISVPERKPDNFAYQNINNTISMDENTTNPESKRDSSNKDSNVEPSNGNNTDHYYNSSNGQNYHRDYKRPQNKPNILLLILLGVILLPIGLPVVITIMTFMFSIAITVISLWLAFAITSAVMLITAVIVIGISLFQLFTIPALGFLLAGSGLIIFGVGSLFLLVTIWMTRTVLPFLFNGIKSIIKLPFQKRRTFA